MSQDLNRRSFLKGAGVAGAAALTVPSLVLDGAGLAAASTVPTSPAFTGTYISGTGDTGWLQMLDTAYGTTQPDSMLQNISMCYIPSWNGFNESDAGVPGAPFGPPAQWHGWEYAQNTFGTAYTWMPFFQEPYATWIKNSLALFFKYQSNGTFVDVDGHVGPPGIMSDGITTTYFRYVEGDGAVDIHDWCLGENLALVIMAAEMLLVHRDMDEIAEWIPKLELTAGFFETRRDPSNNLFLGGVASNMLAPSFGGYLKPDGTYGMAYLAELSVNYIAVLDRLIELETMAGRDQQAAEWTAKRDSAASALPLLVTDDGYFVRSIDPDGTVHGVYGAATYGYFEACPNHDAIAFRVVEDDQAQQIYNVIASIPGLRPVNNIVPNYPSYDDMDQPDVDVMGGYMDYGQWVNGGYWPTVGGRMTLGYMRLGQYTDAQNIMDYTLNSFKQFQLDDHYAGAGRSLFYGQVVDCSLDNFAVPGALIRGLFEYQYAADGLRMWPHIPPTITSLQQNFPVLFGTNKLYISVKGSGALYKVRVNGVIIPLETPTSFFVSESMITDETIVEVFLGAAPPGKPRIVAPAPVLNVPTPTDPYWDIAGFGGGGDDYTPPIPYGYIGAFYAAMIAAGLEDTFECQEAAVVVKTVQAINDRMQLEAAGQTYPLPSFMQGPADQLYAQTASQIVIGLQATVSGYENSTDSYQQQVWSIWSSAVPQ